MKAEEGFEKLNDHYKGCIKPGLILGDAEAIVGQFGLTVCYAVPCKVPPADTIILSSITHPIFEEHRKNFKENECLRIIKFNDKGLTVDVGWLEPAFLSYEHFKGFRFHNKLFVNA